MRDVDGEGLEGFSWVGFGWERGWGRKCVSEVSLIRYPKRGVVNMVSSLAAWLKVRIGPCVVVGSGEKWCSLAAARGVLDYGRYGVSD